jgi:hypothetical protein
MFGDIAVSLYDCVLQDQSQDVSGNQGDVPIRTATTAQAKGNANPVSNEATSESGVTGKAPGTPKNGITWGQTPDEVLAILGPPASVTMGAKSVYSYPHVKVVFADGKVSEIYPQ